MSKHGYVVRCRACGGQAFAIVGARAVGKLKVLSHVVEFDVQGYECPSCHVMSTNMTTWLDGEETPDNFSHVVAELRRQHRRDLNRKRTERRKTLGMMAANAS